MTRAGNSLLVVPANNTTMEREMNGLCSWAAPFMVARVPRPPRTLLVEDLPAYGKSTVDAVEPYVARRPDLVVYGCTAAGFLGGPRGNAVMVDRLKSRLEAPVVSTAGAMVEILRIEGIKSTALLTPYVKEVNIALKSYFETSGIKIEAISSFNCATTDELGRITEPQVYKKALEAVPSGCQSLFIACSQLPTMGILADLRARLRIPVWSSIAATARCAELVMSGGATAHAQSASTVH